MATRAPPSRSSSATCSTSGCPTATRGDAGRPDPAVRARVRGGPGAGHHRPPVEIVFREVEGLPKGTVKAVIDAYGELVDEGCLAVFGPSITDNCVPDEGGDRGALPRPGDQRDRHPRTGWASGRSRCRMGSMTDEPIFWAHLLAKGGHDRGRRARRAVAGRRELHQVTSARACRDKGIRIVAEEPIAQTAQDIGDAGRASCTRPRRRRSCTAASASASCSSTRCSRSSAGIRRASWARRSRTPGSTRSCGTPSSAGPASTSTTRATWSARRSSTSTRPAYGRRPEYCVPVVNRDLATVLLHAFADAHPLSPARRQGGARAGEDAPRRVRRARHAASRSATGPTGAGWAPATSWPGSSIPTARPPTSSSASGRTEPMTDAARRRRRPPTPASAAAPRPTARGRRAGDRRRRSPRWSSSPSTPAPARSPSGSRTPTSPARPDRSSRCSASTTGSRCTRSGPSS